MADLTISISLDASGLNSGVSAAQSKFESLKTSLASVGEKIQVIGGAVSSVGQTLTSSITAPLMSIATRAVETSKSFDALKQGLTAIEGSSQGAEAAFARLRDVAKLPGLGFKEAVQGYTNLRAAGIGAETAERSLKAFGNALATVGKGKDDLNGVITALQQMQSKGKVSAEEINQISERLPQMRVAMQNAFGTTDTDALAKKGIDSQKFINGIVTELEKLPQASGGITAAFENLGDTIDLALVPVGDAINRFLVPAIEQVGPFVDRLSQNFSSLSPEAQGVVIVIAAIAASIGPVLLAIGGLITAIGAIAASISAIVATGTVGVVIAGIAAAIGVLVAGIGVAIGVVLALREAWAAGFGPIASIVVIAIAAVITAFSPIFGLPILIAAVAYTIYELWANNFGGLQDFTAQVWAKIQEYIAIAMAAIQQLVAEIGADMIAWWNENYPLIEQTVKTVSDAVKAYIEAWLTAITEFWNNHGEQIMSVVQSMWTIISNTVRTGIQVVMGIVRLVMQVINGDWAGAWQTAKDIVSKVISAVGTILKEMHNIIFQALKFVVTALVNWGTDLMKRATDIGRNIVQGIINGIGALADTLVNYGRSLVSGLLGAMSSTAETRSPSLYTTRLGRYLGEGYINGLDSMSGPMAATSVAVVSNSLETMGAEGKEVAKTEVKKITAEVVKGSRDGLRGMSAEAKKAIAEFEKVLKTDTQARQDMFTVSEFGTAKSQLESLIKLRQELNQNVGDPLPRTLKEINKELEALEKKKQGVKEAADMLKQMQEALAAPAQAAKTNAEKVERLLADAGRAELIDKETQAQLRQNAALLDARKRTEELADAKKKLTDSGVAARAQIQLEIDLLQAQIDNNFKLNEIEAQRIRNKAEVDKMKADLKEKGYTDPEIAGQVTELEAQQKLTDGLRATLRTKQDLIAAQQTYKGAVDQMQGTLDDLNVKLGITNELTAVGRFEKQLAAGAYATLNEQQLTHLRQLAEEIDLKQKDLKAQEEAKKKFQEFKGFIGESLNTLINDGFGAMFKGIVNKFKKMLIDMATEWIASKIFKLFFPDSQTSGGGGGGGGAGNILSTIMGWFGFNKKGSSGSAAGGENGGGGEAPKVSSFGGLFSPVKNVLNGKESALAGTMAGIGSLATLAGSVIGGRVGGVISMAGMGMSIGANFGPWGAAIGAAAGAIIGLFMGDPKKKVDKKENMPKLQKGFTDAMQQLRDLLSDRNALFSDPDGAVAKAMEIRGQIASGFGIEFQSKKYKKEAQKLIAQKLVEADGVIKQIKDMADVARAAGKVDSRLEAEFAGGVFADRAFIRQHADFKRRNGMLAGQFTGRDTLPSMLAPGEMVLNPRQIERVKLNAGFDAFRGAGIPNYATGGYIGASDSPGIVPASSAPQPVSVQIVLNNSGIVESDIKGVLVNGLKSTDVQVELVKAYDKGKTRARG